MKAEEQARQEIDQLLAAAGWRVQDLADANLHAARGVALREFPLESGFGFADYLLYVDGKAAGVIEAKKAGATLIGVESQSSRYAAGLPASLPAWRRPLPFLYESTGVETHFTNGLDPEPRALIQAMVTCVAPKPGERICDPACGTGGFLLAANHYITHENPHLERAELRRLKNDAFMGWELVQATARVCAMNLMLHGIGSEESVPVRVADALAADPGERFQVVLANPPFGKKSSTVIVGEDGKTTTEKDIIERDDFWATTSNKQLNFVQHIKTLLDIHGRAAVVVPDNVLFEGGAGETIRRKLLHECDVHTLLRLPTGIFYAQGVKANVIFFDKKPASETPWTKKLWIYDLRTNQHFTLKTNPLKVDDLMEFVAAATTRRIATSAQPTWNSGESGRPLARLRLRGTGGTRQGEPGHLLAQGRRPGGLGQAAGPRDHCPGNRGRPGGGAGTVPADRDRSRGARGLADRPRYSPHPTTLR